MQIIIGGTIKVINSPENIGSIIRKSLTLINPQYQMAIRMAQKYPGKRKMMWAIPEKIKYYEQHGNAIEMGRGFGTRLKKIISVNNIKCDHLDERVSPILSEKLEEKIILRDYQVGIEDDVLKHRQGILKLSTAWGKTILSFRLIEKTQLKTLIICCKSEANELSKYRNDFRKIYGKEIGVIQGEAYDIKDITVATMSTLAKRDLEKLKNEFGMVIVDECHYGMSDKRRKIIGKFNAERLYGMSGTPGRANAQSEALIFTFGEIIIDRKLPQDKPEIHIYKSQYEPIGTEYYEMENDICESKERNEFLAGIVKKYLDKNRKILFLTKRISHGKLIASMLPRNIRSYSLSSEDDQKFRSDIIQELRDKKTDFDILIGTYSLFSTGLDIPIIDAVILGMSIKVDNGYNATLIQSIGRCMRIVEGKERPLVVDIDDENNKIMHRHFLSRMQEYNKNEFEIIKLNK